ncbi:hypothetical protein IFM89_000822 [Coptis chinensis]|uniref:Uncharacterized protein n=1 Tax=Coptis chinensis TaxID=261450 RepID=A0A835M890_9MAGN|nr:hypothetical protein IFM89_000822 [Coptis chinensis]
MVEQVFESKVRRLLKFDMLAVLRELLRQNEALLALQVFKDVRKEYWYKPQVLVYADMIKMFASNDFLEKVELLLLYLKIERYHLDADTEGFNALFRTLMNYGFSPQITNKGTQQTIYRLRHKFSHQNFM